MQRNSVPVMQYLCIALLDRNLSLSDVYSVIQATFSRDSRVKVENIHFLWARCNSQNTRTIRNAIKAMHAVAERNSGGGGGGKLPTIICEKINLYCQNTSVDDFRRLHASQIFFAIYSWVNQDTRCGQRSWDRGQLSCIAAFARSHGNRSRALRIT